MNIIYNYRLVNELRKDVSNTDEIKGVIFVETAALMQH